MQVKCVSHTYWNAYNITYVKDFALFGLQMDYLLKPTYVAAFERVIYAAVQPQEACLCTS